MILIGLGAGVGVGVGVGAGGGVGLGFAWVDLDCVLRLAAVAPTAKPRTTIRMRGNIFFIVGNLNLIQNAK